MRHLLPLIGDQEKVSVLDAGAGPYGIIYCKFANGADLTVTPIDHRDFPGITKENMEDLPYSDNTFDIVQTINALDHTKYAKKALQELIRVAKNWVYIDCNLIQRTTSGGWHYWDAQEDGRFISKNDEFDLKDFGFEVKLVNNGETRSRNQIIATLHKGAVK